MTINRTATRADLDEILNWAAQEGWNPGVDDANAFFATDPEGFFVAENDDGTPIASISVVNHSADFSFLGLYLVRPDHRGKGIGYGLWKHAIAHAKGRTIGLDGVEAQQENYIRSGFVHAGGTTRFTGDIRGVECGRARLASPDDIPDLIDREKRASGIAKPGYLREWFSNTPDRKTFLLAELDGPCGFVTVRACRTGAKIGPLLAENEHVARRLIMHAAAQFAGDITIDVPQPSDGLSMVCQQFDMAAGFKTARMYRGAFNTAEPEYFAVSSLELG